MRRAGGNDGDGGGGSSSAHDKGQFILGAGLVGLGGAGVATISGVGIAAAPVMLGFGLVAVVVGGTIMAVTSDDGCFVAGTTVSTPNGLGPIERIQTGDEIRSVDLQDRRCHANRVVKTFRFGRITAIELGFNDETIVCTPRHRFYRDGWVAAANLQPGDRLSCGDGTEVELKTSRRKLDVQFVYNFSVAGPHNYLVGNSGLLVHNLKKKDTRDKTDDKP